MQQIGEIQTELVKEIQGQDTSSWTCPACKTTDQTQYFLQIIYTGKKDFNFPTFIPQVKECCSVCGRYRRFHKQTDQLITRINERLEKIPIESKGWRDGV